MPPKRNKSEVEEFFDLIAKSSAKMAALVEERDLYRSLAEKPVRGAKQPVRAAARYKEKAQKRSEEIDKEIMQAAADRDRAKRMIEEILDHKCAAVVRLKVLSGKTFKEIAGLLSVSEQTVHRLYKEGVLNFGMYMGLSTEASEKDYGDVRW